MSGAASNPASNRSQTLNLELTSEEKHMFSIYACHVQFPLRIARLLDAFSLDTVINKKADGGIRHHMTPCGKN